MRERIFSLLKNLTPEPDNSSKIEDILNELHQLRSTASQVRAESILLEELRQLNNSASQVRNEISNTLYFYLIGITIITAGVIGLLSLYFQYREKPSISLHSIEFFIMGTLIFSGIVSVMFIQRLQQLTREQSQYFEAIDALKTFFSERLEIQGINKRLFNIENSLNSINSIPTYIRYIIIPVGSFAFSSAAYTISGFISFRLASTFSFSSTWALAISIIFSIFVFSICFFFLELRYR